jgi:hypothetical protein
MGRGSEATWSDSRGRSPKGLPNPAESGDASRLSPRGRTSRSETYADGRRGLQARAWGWVMESGELTGTVLAHVRELPRGIVSE